MRKSRKFLQTDFIKFILEKYSNQEGQGLPDDEIENPDEEQRKRKSIRKLNEFDDEVQGEEEPVDDEETDDEIIECVELAVEQITIDLMHDEFDVYTESGELNRFVIRNTENNLNIVCVLQPGEWEFKLIVITVMKKDDFRTSSGQYVVEVNPN